MPMACRGNDKWASGPVVHCESEKTQYVSPLQTQQASMSSAKMALLTSHVFCHKCHASTTTDDYTKSPIEIWIQLFDVMKKLPGSLALYTIISLLLKNNQI